MTAGVVHGNHAIFKAEFNCIPGLLNMHDLPVPLTSDAEVEHAVHTLQAFRMGSSYAI
jgi:hypothetical protein